MPDDLRDAFRQEDTTLKQKTIFETFPFCDEKKLASEFAEFRLRKAKESAEIRLRKALDLCSDVEDLDDLPEVPSDDLATFAKLKIVPLPHYADIGTALEKLSMMRRSEDEALAVPVNHVDTRLGERKMIWVIAAKVAVDGRT